MWQPFFAPLGDTVFQRIQHDIKQKGNESRLDDYLSTLRSACLQLGPELSKKPDTWKSFHLGLFDLPLEAKTKLGEIEGLMLHYINEVIVWEEIERLGKEFRITGDWNILTVALDFHRTMVRNRGITS
jgi:hypothetical protein